MIASLTRSPFASLALTLLSAGALGAQEPSRPAESPQESSARLARRGAGLTGATWSPTGLVTPTGATTSSSPFLEGYFRRGLDQHLALETSVAFWQRTLDVPTSGGLTGAPGGKTSLYLIPQFTAIRLYPFTRAGDALEPYLSGGVGLTLGIQNDAGSGGALGGGGGTAMLAGIGLSGSAGVEWRFSSAFGLTAGAHYTYVQFFEDLAGNRLYRGLGVRAGLTYRFQY